MFSTMVQSIMADPQYGGPLSSYTHKGTAGVPGDGPYLQLWFVVEDGVIRKAAYKTYGCPSSIAAGSMTARLLTGLPVEKAHLLTGADLLKLLGGLPEGKEECAHRAIAALKNALRTE